MQCSLIARRVGNEWEAALLADGKFQRAFIGPHLPILAARSIGMILGEEFPENTEIGIDVHIVTPMEDSRGPDKAEG